MEGWYWGDGIGGMVLGGWYWGDGIGGMGSIVERGYWGEGQYWGRYFGAEGVFGRGGIGGDCNLAVHLPRGEGAETKNSLALQEVLGPAMCWWPGRATVVKGHAEEGDYNL